jgi:hypothetical protein
MREFAVTDEEIPELKPEVLEHGIVHFPTPNLTNHNYKQRGINVHCDTCPTPHGFYLEPDKQLTGIDANGYPVIKSISN